MDNVARSGPRRRPVVPRRLARHLGARIHVHAVGPDGLTLAVRGPDRVVDVLFDGRRIWSFWVVRDTRGQVGLRRHVAWPDRMQRFLDGRSRVEVVEHVTGTRLHDQEVAFTDTDRRIAFVNNRGLEISLDKSGRFSPTFSGRGDQVAPLLDAMEEVVAALAALDVTAFPAWGTLLGAVREQNLLGHDSDADLAYLSSYTAPVDVARESFRLQRALNAKGFVTYRYSGAAFRIQVTESDGATRGLDLFAAFFDHDRLYVMGEVGADYRREWLWPLTTCRIGDREFAAPARPEKLLEASYGLGWRVPDPAFRFRTPPDVTRRLDAWFRGTAPHRADWERALAGPAHLGTGPSALARLVHAEAPPGATVVDVGTGHGRDAWWWARQGRTVIGYDFVPRAGAAALRRAEAAGLPLTLRPLNLTELRSVYGEGAWISRRQGPRVLVARHLLDATSAAGRANVARFAAMALRRGGRLYAEFLLAPTEQVDRTDAPGPLAGVDVAEVVALLEAQGGRVLSTTVAADGTTGPVARLSAEWR
ncbi:class I SAM-dependent methyltransferase [Nocardioides sambongensis]|uniref:class I SAM-dependent methyltransferase n=1 Tax=Nocardioides sambongensis TaxID=2589074 RepID=UPI0011279C22|nr:class I SAM-dependent methyltransferase [Nocardioides sambongensis]